MKILQINATYGSGSTGRNVQEQHEYYLSKGLDSYVAYAIIGKKEEKVFRIGSTVDHKLHALLSRITGLQGHYSYFATRRLLKKMNKIAPDVVHLHNLHSNYIHLPSLLKYLAKKDIATIITLHDFWLFTGRCYHYLYDDCEKYQTECGECPYLKRTYALFDGSKKDFLIKRQLFSQIKRLGIVGVSEWSIHQAETGFFKSYGEKTHIYNWVDGKVFYPRVRQASVRKTIIAVSQGWSEEKGLSQAIELAEALKDEAELLLIGRMAKRVSLPKNIRSIGYVGDVKQLVNFSIIETFGKVVIEAMACGTPAVVFDSTALTELVVKGGGKAVKPGDISEMVQAVREILNKGKDFYQEKCLRIVQENFAYQNQVEKYLEFYGRIKNGKI